MNHLVYGLRDKMKRFAEPVRIHKVCMCVCTVTILAVLHVGISLVLNSDDVVMLGGEMLCESGPCFNDAAEKHIETLGKYVI